MTVHIYLESIRDTILNCLIHSANIYSTAIMLGWGAAEVNETLYLPSLLISSLQKRELGDSL